MAWLRQRPASSYVLAWRGIVAGPPETVHKAYLMQAVKSSQVDGIEIILKLMLGYHSSSEVMKAFHTSCRGAVCDREARDDKLCTPRCHGRPEFELGQYLHLLGPGT